MCEQHFVVVGLGGGFTYLSVGQFNFYNRNLTVLKTLLCTVIILCFIMKTSANMQKVQYFPLKYNGVEVA